MKKGHIIFLSSIVAASLVQPIWADAQIQDELADEKELELAAEMEGDDEEELDMEDASAEEEKVKGRIFRIGVSMPDEEDSHVTAQMDSLKEELLALGYHVQVKSAEGREKTQNDHIEEWLEEGVDAMVIHPVEQADLTGVLEEAGDEIPLISYGDLIQNSEKVDCLVTFDHLDAGRQIGTYLVEKEELEELEDGESKTIEFLMGDPEVTTELLYYTGLMEVLAPYLENGKLICRSGGVSLEDAGIPGGDAQEAGRKIRKVLKEFYNDEVPDVICTASDEMAAEVWKAVEKLSEELPVITGRGITKEGAARIVEGTQSVSTYGSDEELGKLCSQVVHALLQKEDTEAEAAQYDNGVKVIPSRQCQVKIVHQENYKEILLDGGVFTPYQLPSIEEKVNPEK